MTVWYLHGLESKAGGAKVDFLYSKADKVYAPEMDYNHPEMFTSLLRLAKYNKPDLIIGSSMGGYFADALGSHLDVDLVYFRGKDYFFPQFGIPYTRYTLPVNLIDYYEQSWPGYFNHNGFGIEHDDTKEKCYPAVRSDNFTNQTIVSMIINEILKEKFNSNNIEALVDSKGNFVDKSRVTPKQKEEIVWQRSSIKE